ncbi:MAG: hypothetical protein L0H55_16475 [Candidatus Nitrosocosmicus sp.]|nr:hypothetical protein [Candidatus Nitrosocosmicus sp.]
MKFTSKLFLLPFLPVLVASLLTLTCFGIESDSKLTYDTSAVANFSQTNQINLESKRSSDNSSLALGTEEKKGVLIMKVTTFNGENGRNFSSDFTVNIHANDPVPDTFKGNTSGTVVKLSMGMYSVTTSSIPYYNSSYSNDCNGGIMTVETKDCKIVMTHSKSE